MGSKKMGTDKGIHSNTVLWNCKPIEEKYQAGERVSSLHQTQATFIRRKDFDNMLKDKMAAEFFARFRIDVAQFEFEYGQKITTKIVARMLDSAAAASDEEAPGQLMLDSEIVKQQIEEVRKKGFFFLSDEGDFLNPDQFVAKFAEEGWEFWSCDWITVKPEDHIEGLAELAEAAALHVDEVRKAVKVYNDKKAAKKKAAKEAAAKDKAKKE